MTLNGRTTLYCTNVASFGAHDGNLKEYRHTQYRLYYQRQKFSPCTVLSDDKRSCGYSCWFRGDGAWNDCRGV